jgi:hypothetical protein
MEAPESMFSKQAMYGLITAFFVICTAVFVTLGLSYIARYTTLIKVRAADSYKEDLSIVYQKELVQYCYGRIIDPSISLDPACIRQGSMNIRGLGLSVVPSPGCEEQNLTLLEPTEYTSAEVLSIPVYQNNQTQICPGRLHIYT